MSGLTRVVHELFDFREMARGLGFLAVCAAVAWAEWQLVRWVVEAMG